ncbi:DNA topoisomerase IV, B subunit, partial [mine drainage metagenome]
QQLKRSDSQLDLALAWLPEGELVQESYVNLIPTTQGGTHVNGLRSGLTSALREFCELRNLLPRGLKLAPEDIWERVTYVLSLRMKDPQFAGQTKERLSSRDAAGLVEGAVHDAFSLWLNQHVEMGEAIAQLAIERANARLKAAKQVVRKRITQGPALPGKLADCQSQDLARTELFWSRAIPPAVRPSRRATASFRRSCRCAARSSTPGKSNPARCWPVRKCTIWPWPSAAIPAWIRSKACATARSSSSPTPIPTACTSPRC